MMGGKMAPPIRPMSIRPEISFWRSGRYSVINHLFLGMAHAGRQGLASAGTSLSQREHEPKNGWKSMAYWSVLPKAYLPAATR